jgi:group I intron endonuclease
MIIYTIYKVVNLINGKVYIGFDSNWPNRQKIHKSNYPKIDYKFYQAIKKYGWDNFNWEILYQSKEKEYTLKFMENYFIEQYDSFKNGYNSTLGGEGVFGLKRTFTTEERQKRKLKMLGNKIGLNNLGKPKSDSHKQNISKGKKGKKIKPMTEEHKRNISLAKKKNHQIQI